MILYLLLAIIVLLTAAILPWINYAGIRDLKEEVEKIKKQISQLNNETQLQSSSQIKSPWANSAQNNPQNITPKQIIQIEEEYQNQEQYSAPKKDNKLERNFGLKLPIWIGAIAIILSGFYLVKYSIENEILTNQVKIILGLSASIILQIIANIFKKKSQVLNSNKIAQSLSGSAIAIAYLSIFSATTIYHFITPIYGFLLMAAITAFAIYASIKFGQAVALLGISGGFLTPILIGHNEISIFSTIYLSILTIAFFRVIRKNGWWFLMAIIIIFIGIYCNFLPYQYNSLLNNLSIYTLLAVCGWGIIYTLEQENHKSNNIKNFISYFGIVLVVISASNTVFKANYGMLETAIFSLFIIALIVITHYRYYIFNKICWLSLVMSFLLIFYNQNNDINSLLFMINSFSLINIFGAYLCFTYPKNSGDEQKIYWSIFMSVAMVGFYVVSYYKLTNFTQDIEWLWSIIALLAALLSLILLRKTIIEVSQNDVRQKIFTALSITISTFIFIAALLYFDNGIFPTIIACQIASTALISTKVQINSLRKICLALGGIFILLLIFKFNFYLTIFTSPLFYVGIPSLMFAASAIFLKKESDDNIVKTFETASIILATTTLISLIQNSFGNNQGLIIQTDFLERGLISLVIFIVGVLAFKCGDYLKRSAIFYCGLALCLVAITRVTFLDLLTLNPYFTSQNLGNYSLINYSIINYLLPAILSICLIRYIEIHHTNSESLLKKPDSITLQKIFGLAAGILLFSFLSIEIAHFYRGAVINSSKMGNAELYSYSAIWIIFALATLSIGIIKNSKSIRIYSLTIITITIFKVFLFDASGLQGLYRVFSFFGLGFSLILLSYVYSKFIFNNASLEKNDQKN
jgi:uncharacterized membrane protein